MAELNMKLRQQISQNTDSYFHDIWLRNARVNYANAKYYKKFNNIPYERRPMAVVCGSGASLELHYDFLKKYRDKLTIFAADTAFAILYKAGIYADYVVNIDAGSVKSCFAFKDYDILCRNTKLIASTVSEPESLDAFRGDKYLFNLVSNVPTLLNVAQMWNKLACVPSKYNVGEFMLFLANRYFFIKDIALIGLDFCEYNYKYYSDGGAIDGELEKFHTYLYDSDFKLVRTDRVLLVYMIELYNNYIDEYSKKSRIYNLSKGILPLRYSLDRAIEFLEKTV